TRTCRTIPWPAPKHGPPACRCRRTRSTIRPPSKSSMTPSTSSPRGTGSCSPTDTKGSAETRNSPAHCLEVVEIVFVGSDAFLELPVERLLIEGRLRVTPHHGFGEPLEMLP